MKSVAEENFFPSAFVAILIDGPMWVVKSSAKKLKSGDPSTLNMATRLAESIPFLKNFKPKPGAILVESGF